MRRGRRGKAPMLVQEGGLESALKMELYACVEGG